MFFRLYFSNIQISWFLEYVFKRIVNGEVVLKMELFLQPDVPALGEVASFGSDYFLLKIKIVAECEGVFTVKFVIV